MHALKDLVSADWPSQLSLVYSWRYISHFFAFDALWDCYEKWDRNKIDYYYTNNGLFSLVEQKSSDEDQEADK